MKVASKAILTGIAQHKERRRRETAKLPDALRLTDAERREQLRDKHDDREPREPRRGFYDPYG